MRVALVVAGVPNPAAGGATLTNWTIASYLLGRGHEVVVMPLLPRVYVDATAAAVEDRIARLRALGAEVRPFESASDGGRFSPSRAAWSRVRRMWRPEDELLFPHFLDRDAAADAISELGADAAFVYHWEALAATSSVTDVPRLGVAVDLAHLPPLYRWRADLRRPSAGTVRAVIRLQAQARAQSDVMVQLMNGCAACGDFAAHHAAWLREQGAAGCEYLHTPVPDPGPPGERDARSHRPRILLIGHLRGTATQDGLALFARHVLPRLERELGPDAFDVRVVGGYEPPPDLRRGLDRPSVVFAGHTEDPSEEFLGADVMIVPTTIPLGTRVRILSAFSHGCCVVAHRSNALGIPELAHGGNVLLGRTGGQLAGAVLAALADSELRDRIGRGGRATYERLFSPPVAAGRIERILAGIAR